MITCLKLIAAQLDDQPERWLNGRTASGQYEMGAELFTATDLNSSVDHKLVSRTRKFALRYILIVDTYKQTSRDGPKA